MSGETLRPNTDQPGQPFKEVYFYIRRTPGTTEEQFVELKNIVQEDITRVLRAAYSLEPRDVIHYPTPEDLLNNTNGVSGTSYYDRQKDKWIFTPDLLEPNEE